MKTPFLEGKKIYLREIGKKDLTEKYRQWFNDDKVCQFNSHHRFPNYQQNMDDYYKNVIRSRENLVLAIVDKKKDIHIGNISLQNISQIDRSAELAIVIGDKEYWGKGIGVEACNLIVGHGFSALNLHRIYCGTSDGNKGMQKLAEKMGFKKEGISREALFKDGKYHDIVNYGILKKEHKSK